jgi:hypothetical protein
MLLPADEKDNRIMGSDFCPRASECGMRMDPRKRGIDQAKAVLSDSRAEFTLKMISLI